MASAAHRDVSRRLVGDQGARTRWIHSGNRSAIRGANRLWVVSLLTLILSAAGAAPHPLQRHEAYAEILRSCVRDGWVDYAALKSSPARLAVYLDEMAALPRSEFMEWPREDRLALLINLYNAWTLHLIVEHYPIRSIRGIGLLPNAAWRQRIVRFGDEVISLDALEHGIIREEYQDPRIHFALVCAAAGCPPLRNEPYVGKRLNDQLNDQAARFLADETKNRFDPDTRTLWLSPIFKWYAADFSADGATVVEYVARFLPTPARTLLSNAEEAAVRYTEYDWSLNDVRRR
jgi:hypothetical protein